MQAASQAIVKQAATDGTPSPYLTVIVPVGPGETAWRGLLHDLATQRLGAAEILAAAVTPEPVEFSELNERLGLHARWLTVRVGRAAQMNDAARIASGAYLWFLHADSRLPADALTVLRKALRVRTDELCYFGLRFFDGPPWLRWNELGVAVRCRLFGLPFGDQGFCLRRETFFRLGGFDETATYGEDHLLVWAAKRNDVRLRRVPETIATSGRRYAEQGWLKTTLRHLRLTFRQALPQAFRHIRERLR